MRHRTLKGDQSQGREGFTSLTLRRDRRAIPPCFPPAIPAPPELGGWGANGHSFFDLRLRGDLRRLSGVGTLSADGVPSLAPVRRLLFPIIAVLTRQYSAKRRSESRGRLQMCYNERASAQAEQVPRRHETFSEKIVALACSALSRGRFLLLPPQQESHTTQRKPK